VAERSAGRRVLVVVDEGQSWSLAALEELRLLLDLRSDGQALAQVLLVGQPGLDDLLAAAELTPLRQRIVVRHRLGQLGADEVAPYVEHRLRCVGWHDDPRVTVDAHAVIFAYTEGLPRLINRLCSRLLVLGAIEHRHEIDAAAVADAIAEAELEPLPPPAAADAHAGAAAGAAHWQSEADAAAPAAATPQTPSTQPPPIEPLDAAPGAPGSAGGLAGEAAAIDRWWAEVARLQLQLERALGDLSGERSRAEGMRAEADRLRAELHRIELDRLRLDAETSRRAVEALARATHPEDARLFRRFADEDA
jgi:hypothetical protein